MESSRKKKVLLLCDLITSSSHARYEHNIAHWRERRTSCELDRRASCILSSHLLLCVGWFFVLFCLFVCFVCLFCVFAFVLAFFIRVESLVTFGLSLISLCPAS